MKFSRLMFVFSGVHLRTRRDSFFLSTQSNKAKDGNLRRRSRIWRSHTSSIDGFHKKYVTGEWIEVNVDLWVLDANDFFILEDLV